MKKLIVIISKANDGVSAHLPELDGYVIARDTVQKLKKDIYTGVQFHIEGLYEEERQEWMNGEYQFEFVFNDLPAMLEAYRDFLNQSSLARIAGINQGQIRQYMSGVKRPTKRTLERIETGLRRYADELQTVAFV